VAWLLGSRCTHQARRLLPRRHDPVFFRAVSETAGEGKSSNRARGTTGADGHWRRISRRPEACWQALPEHHRTVGWLLR